ncbi:hypothetical protein MUSASHINO07_00350 [Gemella sp. Musashino-2025]
MEKVGFGTLNGIMLVVYLLAMLGVGISLKKQVPARMNFLKQVEVFPRGR